MSAAAAHWWRVDECDGIYNFRAGFLLSRFVFMANLGKFGRMAMGSEKSVGNTWTVDIKSIVGGQDCRAKGPM